jgi:hypothetical protein
MISAQKMDYLKVQTLEYSEINYLSDYDKYIAGIEYNEKSFKFNYGDIKYKSANDIVNDLEIKVNALYKYINADYKENAFNDILLTIAELIFRLRIDLGVK